MNWRDWTLIIVLFILTFYLISFGATNYRKTNWYDDRYIITITREGHTPLVYAASDFERDITKSHNLMIIYTQSDETIEHRMLGDEIIIIKVINQNK